MSILIPKEDKRPRVVCPHCKTEVIVDIRPFNEDMTRLAEFTCVNCRRPFYGGVILLVGSTVQRLIESIQLIVNAANAKNTLWVGEPGANTKLKN